ncbi:MAG TPA: hypothetical protein VM818_16235 [Vicinamibacterales bacterium]|nr:hypothetical protein [Vicinamibacterales bacterium]
MPAVRDIVSIGAVVLTLGVAPLASADETDNFTCRNRPLRDSLAALDTLMNTAVHAAVERANGRGASCDGACLVHELQEAVGGNVRAVTGIPHARLARLVENQPGIERCHLNFRESIYGARPYNQPWLAPFTGRIIFLADSIQLAGRLVGIDKINHFIREGLAHWQRVHDGGEGIEAVMARELGAPGWQLRMNEHGLKGMTLTGVVSYADLAASYSGFRFWSDLLMTDSADSFVAYDETTRQFRQRRAFTFRMYVTDAWDESINPSAFHPDLAKQVAAALRARSVEIPIASCQRLTALPQARLYVNPGCFDTSEMGR